MPTIRDALAQAIHVLRNMPLSEVYEKLRTLPHADQAALDKPLSDDERAKFTSFYIADSDVTLAMFDGNSQKVSRLLEAESEPQALPYLIVSESRQPHLREHLRLIDERKLETGHKYTKLNAVVEAYHEVNGQPKNGLRNHFIAISKGLDGLLKMFKPLTQQEYTEFLTAIRGDRATIERHLRGLL